MPVRSRRVRAIAVVAVADPAGVESGPAVAAQVQHGGAEEVRILLRADAADGDDPVRVAVLEHREGGHPGDVRHVDDPRASSREPHRGAGLCR